MAPKLPCLMYSQNNLLYVKLTGVWTKTTASRVLNDLKQIVAPIQHAPWAALVDMRDWIMPTVDAMSAFEEIYQWCIENNQTHEATICRPSLQQQIVKSVSDYNQETQLYCAEPDEAVAWLKSKGFTAASQPDFQAESFSSH